MTNYLPIFKTIVVFFSLLLLTMIVSSTANAVSKNLQAFSKFKLIQIADLKNPGAAVIHRRNAKERRHGKANQSTTTPSNTKPQ